MKYLDTIEEGLAFEAVVEQNLFTVLKGGGRGEMVEEGKGKGREEVGWKGGVGVHKSQEWTKTFLK